MNANTLPSLSIAIRHRMIRVIYDTEALRCVLHWHRLRVSHDRDCMASTHPVPWLAMIELTTSQVRDNVSDEIVHANYQCTAACAVMSSLINIHLSCHY